MADRRRYTGTQRLQVGWTLVVGAAAGTAWVGAPGLVRDLGDEGVVLAGVGAVWLAGLLLLGYRERRAWRRLVARSSFEPQGGVQAGDLQRIVRGHTVTVGTVVPSLLAQTHTRVRASVDGVDADFTITVRHVGPDGTAAGGLTTGNPDLDDRFVFEGNERNVTLLLTPDVQAALMDLDVPATIEATSDQVVCDIPFTTVTPNELRAAADAVVEVVERLERVGTAA